MSNTHTVPDFASELQATCEDLLPPCVISLSWPTAPVPPSMTLAAFTTQAYCRDLQQLVYVDQPAITLTLSGSDGVYWLAITRDVSTAYSGWTRRSGSHYAWRLSGSRPADVDGLLVFASCTVAGGVITAVTPAPGVTLAEAWRARAGLGTMAQQDAANVAITGGSVTGLSSAEAVRLGVATPSIPTTRVALLYNMPTEHGIQIQSNSDTPGATAVRFLAAGGSQVGSIVCTATATAYNTSSDVRLKHAIAPLTGALGVVQALKPVTFRWNSDDSSSEGFLAHELQQTIPDAVTGEADAVNEDGSIKPQQVDHSRLVVWLVSAVQELAAQLDAAGLTIDGLMARVAALEGATP